MADKSLTTEAALAAWESGNLVWSVEMGGLGPGYEQAIQVMAFAFLRWMVDNPPPDGWDAFSDCEKWRRYIDQCDAADGPKKVVGAIGPSGAQHGAAMNMAAVFAKQGYAKGLSMVDADRHILVSNAFPAIAA